MNAKFWQTSYATVSLANKVCLCELSLIHSDLEIRKKVIDSANPDQTPQDVASAQGLHCLLTGFSIKNRTTRQNIPDTPKKTNKLGQRITVEESTSIQLLVNRSQYLIVNICNKSFASGALYSQDHKTRKV